MPSLAVAAHAEAPAGWGALVRAHGSFYHEPAWVEGLARCFGFRAHYLTASAGDRTVGALPLLEVPGLLGKRRLVSLPFSYAAGTAASDEEAVPLLYEAARDLATRVGAARVEVKRRGLAPAPTGWARSTHYSTYRVRTDSGLDAIFKRLHSSTQRGIKKARKSPLTVSAGTSLEDWATMADLQERTSHRLGVPAPPRRFFVELCRELQSLGLADLLIARLPDAGAVAAIVLWKGAREWIYAFGASLPAHLEHRPNHLLLWTAAEGAAQAGVVFDLGRAAPEQAGLVEFKERWGGEPEPLAYDYWPGAAGVHAAARDRGPLALAGRVWSKLPFAVARRGSFLYRYLG